VDSESKADLTLYGFLALTAALQHRKTAAPNYCSTAALQHRNTAAPNYCSTAAPNSK